MRVDCKRIIIELLLQTIVELAPASLGVLAVVAEYLVQLTHNDSTGSIQMVVPANEQQLSALAPNRFFAPSLI
ncbi:hypothetical protein H6F77_25635 [Microcoleus sp. FACHB-831]|uniref:hypothetical protein n=1 Tax=Microcoleus sp. FACHB-831 TaxID=2692827 RepID=UPI0016866082|nr:hypothetical protein [Microcoleus sp. FACHB-831]MBD1924426.1 hypothetical protein [Microcoleus sp. FACHB-831]